VTNEHNAIKQVEDSAVIINDWMNANKLNMKTTKTEFIMFGSKAQLGKCSTKEIDIAGDKIPNVSVIRYLGAYLDEGLKFSTLVKTKCRTAMLNYFRIRNIRKYLTQDATKILVLSLVISNLDYCNAILFGISVCLFSVIYALIVIQTYYA